MSDSTTQLPPLEHLHKAEFNGFVSRTLSEQQQSDFALLLAMLQQDVAKQVHLSEAEEQAFVGHLPIEAFNFYPVLPLKAEDKHYSQQVWFSQAIKDMDLANARLLANMHPCPLSLNNDDKHISEEIISNCDIFTQLRYSKHKQNEAEDIELDPTLLHETIPKAQEFQAA